MKKLGRPKGSITTTTLPDYETLQYEGKKRCSTCLVISPHSNFRKRPNSGDGYRSQCVQCEAKYEKPYREKNKDIIRQRGREWAKNNPDKRRENQKRLSTKRRIFVREYKRDKPCVDCGVILPPECMDLDHVRGEKKFSISHYAHALKIERVEEELAKCDIRCPNCHRLRHYKEKRKCERRSKGRYNG